MSYRYLTTEEQLRIRQLRSDGCPIREIARTLERPVMTVSQFCKRNGIGADRRGGSYLSRSEKLLAGELGLPPC